MKYAHKLRVSFCLLAMFIGMIILAHGQTNQQHVIVSYVTAGTQPIPDPNLITHINYAFGHVSEDFKAVKIDNPDRLKQISALKKQHPGLKVLLSIGGWGSGRFSEMAANEQYRLAFAKDCKRVVDDFNLDGIDIDWEYPTSAEANISASEHDYDNFTLLMQEIRNQVSSNKLLTLASIADAQFIDFKAIEPLVDFVNIMMYDVGKPPYHHASLYRSSLSGRVTCVEALQAHLDAGMPKNKLVLGLPFYGRGDKKAVPDFVLFKDLGTLKGFTEKWDDQAKVPYLVDAQGQYVLTYENQQSLALKCEFIKQSGILGAMYWEFAGDNQEQELSHLLYNGLNGAAQ